MEVSYEEFKKLVRDPPDYHPEDKYIVSYGEPIAGFIAKRHLWLVWLARAEYMFQEGCSARNADTSVFDIVYIKNCQFDTIIGNKDAILYIDNCKVKKIVGFKEVIFDEIVRPVGDITYRV